MTLAFILAAACMLLGVIACRHLALFRWMHLPACVVAGFFGLALVQTLSKIPSISQSPIVLEVTQQWSSWPSVLIAFVFASMLLMPPRRQPQDAQHGVQQGTRQGKQGNSMASVGREGLMVWIIVLGQAAIGCATVCWLVQPREAVPDAAGMLIETGFAGGHGTAAAMGQVFRSEAIGFEAGSDLGLTMATIGLIYGMVSGVLWANLGIRKGWVSSQVHSNDDPTEVARASRSHEFDGLIDPWMMQAIWLLMAFAVGWILQSGVGTAASWIEYWFSYPTRQTDALASRVGLSAVIGSFPLFIYTLAGGLIVRRILRKLGREDLLDSEILSRQSALVMDILIIAAIGSLNLQAVASGWFILGVLTIAGAIWTAICLLVLSRRILPREHWFELGLINYGMSTGVTATGFVLLRMVDPKLRSGAAEDYALAAPISSPFVGGGILTFAIPLLVLGTFSLAGVTVMLIAIVAAMIVAGLIWGRSE